MFFVMSPHKDGPRVATTEELGRALRVFLRTTRDDIVHVAVGTDDAVMPYVTLHKEFGFWRCMQPGDCIRLGLKQNELPEDEDPEMIALRRGDVVVRSGPVDIISTEHIDKLLITRTAEAKLAVERLLKKAREQ